MSTPAGPRCDPAQLIVACLCAEWCSSCREYRATFDDVAKELSGTRFLWVDVEDDAALVDGIDVDNFPTLFIASRSGPQFFGALAPQRDILLRLVRAHAAGTSGNRLQIATLDALLARLRALPAG